MNEIERLQNNLDVIRKVGGWSCEKFGEFLGLSKQSICNLEHKTVKMSKAQYIAIRAILDYEIEKNDALFAAMGIFLESKDIPDGTIKKARTFFNGLTKDEIKNFGYIIEGLSPLVGSIELQRIVFGTVESSWMDRIMRGEKK